MGHRASHIDPTQPPSNDMAEVIAGAEGITLCPGMPIGQITVMRLDAPAEQGYAERKRS